MQSKAAMPALVAACLLAVACAPRDADIRRARVTAERRNLENALDRLEDRLVLNQSRVRFWNEMKERHESVTAIACASMEEHATEMALKRLRDGSSREVARRSSLDRARVASVHPAAAEAPAPPPPAARAATAPAP
ncbi:hypothetical protein [Anaeromyxobacter oryzae]|uniref:Lipoprotein n=1 Tax=Anaeromyxobacter oryzae TaxID=2918170 RepID=A0ABM7WVJ8_9BACT|nr:hypothetical protein [Anaeromyxobacter oryzae]BDG03533.1 hypothetical protein AMOR_25290 [Anaeromyxobacter oryzae]